uniref:DUF148 domain-containing protein n=1 Tax=Rhabditophanes sp. KR3021 TaxID=114890 RepID=A0AC35TQ26_9BILA
MTPFFKLAVFICALSFVSMAAHIKVSSSTIKTPKDSSEEGSRPKRLFFSTTGQPSLKMAYKPRFGNSTTNLSIDVAQQIPPFLKTASTDTKNQYETIIKNKDLSRNERDEAVDDLVKNQSSAIKAAYQKFKDEREDAEFERQQKISAIGKGLSSDAEDIFIELTNVLQDKSLTNDEIRDKIQSIENGVSDKSQLDDVMAAVHKVFVPVVTKKTTTENTILLN